LSGVVGAGEAQAPEKTVRKKVQIMSHTSEAEFNKYIVILWHGQEQVISLPFEAQHAAVLGSIQQKYPDAQAVSAGLFCAKAGIFWHGGESTSLGLVSRPQDRPLIEALMSSPDRKLWDFTLTAAETQAAAELAG
jgi:hypothetical protein